MRKQPCVAYLDSLFHYMALSMRVSEVEALGTSIHKKVLGGCKVCRDHQIKQWCTVKNNYDNIKHQEQKQTVY